MLKGNLIMLSPDVFTALTESEPLKTIVLLAFLFGLFDTVLKGKLNRLIDYLVRFLVRAIPLIVAKIKLETRSHFSAIPAPSPLTRKISAWGMVVVEVLFSALMTVYGMVFMILTAMLLLKDDPSMIKVLIGGLMGVLMLLIAYYYRAGAHKTARDNNLL